VLYVLLKQLYSNKINIAPYLLYSHLIFVHMDKYQKIEKLGEGAFDGGGFLWFINYFLFWLGTYGIVYKARNKETDGIVALKRIRLDDENEVPLFIVLFAFNSNY
jgi:hypothetical protein